MHPDQLNQQQRDALFCICQQGLEEAAEMLSKLLRQPLGIDAEAGRALDEDPFKAPGICVYVAISGQLNGGLLLFFPEDSANRISCQLLGKDVVDDLLREPACSTLKEVGNILASAFLASLESQLGLRSLPAPPEIARASTNQLLGEKQLGGAGSRMMLRTRLYSTAAAGKPLQGAIYLVPQVESLQLLTDRLNGN